MSIELYVFPPSPRAFKVMAVANHLGLDWTPRVLDARRGDHATALMDGNLLVFHAYDALYFSDAIPYIPAVIAKAVDGDLDELGWFYWYPYFADIDRLRLIVQRFEQLGEARSQFAIGPRAPRVLRAIVEDAGEHTIGRPGRAFVGPDMRRIDPIQHGRTD